MRDKINHSDDPDTYRARTSGLLPGDRIEEFTSGNSDDARIVASVYGRSSTDFADILLLEDLAKQAALPDRFVLKVPTSRKRGRAKK